MKTPTGNASQHYAAVAAGLGMPIEGDVAELGKAPVGGLMGWHELAVTVRQIKEGVGYNYPKLAESLCQHLGHALARLDTQQTELAILVPANEGLGALLGETLKTLDAAYNSGDGPAIGRLIEHLKAKQGPACPSTCGGCQRKKGGAGA